MERTRSTAPVVLRSFPENNSLIEAKDEIALSVTFDRKMDGGCSWVNQGYWDYPQVTGRYHWSPDKKTHTIEAKLEKGKTYVLMINSAEYRNFASEGVPAIPFVMFFHTK